MANKSGMVGWTSSGLSEEASRLLDVMSEDTGLNKREIATLAIHWFHNSNKYQELIDAVEKVKALKEAIRSLEDEYPHLMDMKI